MQLDKTTEKDSKKDSPKTPKKDLKSESQPSPILCRHCLRTATNGIKCQGICVADSNY